MVLASTDAITKWRKLIGPTDSRKARIENPNSLRSIYGTDGSKNALHGSDSKTSAKREIDLIFDGNIDDDDNDNRHD